MVHMKALSVLFNFPYPKIRIHILRYENTTFTRLNLTVLWSSVAVSEQWLSQPNLKIFLDELQVIDMNFETANNSIAYPQKVFGGGSIISGAGVQIAPTFKPPAARFL